MNEQLPVPVVELLFSRMCHDLVGPVGAAVNGVELLEEFGAEMADEALNLLGSSARVASKRLRVYRVAYGMASGAAITSLSDLKLLVDDYIEGGKIELVWPDTEEANSIHLKRLGIKLILNMIICATEALPRGGKLQLTVDNQAGEVKVNVGCTGEGARLAEGVAEAFDTGTDPDVLDPRTVQAFFTAYIAGLVGSGLGFDIQPDHVTFASRIQEGV